MKKAIIALYFIVLALAGWLGYACCCNLSFNPDSSAGLIVSALGIMVTLLIGWQIYKSIQFDEAIKRTDDLHHIANAYLEFAIGMTELREHPERTFRQCVVALERLNNAREAEYENIFMAMEAIAEEPSFMLSAEEKNRALSALRLSKQEGTEDLIKKIKKWGA